MVGIDITHSSNGLACWRIYEKLKLILFVESLRPIGHCLSQLVQRIANYFDLLWYVFLVGMCRGGGYFWKFQFLWVLKNFLPPCTFCRCLVCLQSSRHTSCYEHRHGLTQTCRRNDQICHRGGISQKHKSRLYCDVPQEKSDRCGCKWGDEVGMNDIPFTISRGGAHCGAGNREAGCKLFKLPVYRAFLPRHPSPTPLSYILNCKIHWHVAFQRDLVQTWKMRYTIFIDAEARIRLTTPDRHKYSSDIIVLSISTLTK